MENKKATATDLLDDLHRFYSKHGQMPKAVSLHPEFKDRIETDMDISRKVDEFEEEYKNEFHGIPYIVNPNLESSWLLIKPENL